jgi:hypothetical protein
MIITELDPSGFEIGGDIYFQLRKSAEAIIDHMGAELLDNTLGTIPFRDSRERTLERRNLAINTCPWSAEMTGSFFIQTSMTSP